MVQVVGYDKSKKIDLILIGAPTSDGYKSQDIREIPAYGLGILATIAKNKGYNVGVLDAEAQPRSSLEDIVSTINGLNPRFVGFSSNTPMYTNTLKICSVINRNIPIIIGGVHASALPRQTAEDLRENNFYLLIRGPAEDSIIDILAGIPKEQINSAVFFDSDGNFIENCRKRVGNFQDYPKVDRSFFINDPMSIDDKVISFLLSSRGCFYDCSFCSIHTTWEQGVMFRETEDLINEMKELYSKGVNSFRFLDDLFLVNAHRFRGFCEKLDERGLLGRIEWAANSRVNIVNKFSERDMSLLKESRCSGMGLGLESGSDSVLNSIGKGFTSLEGERAIELLAKKGIKTYGYFILGFPDEGEEEIKQTIEFAYHLSKKYGLRAGIVPYKLYPGSRDYRKIIGKNPSREKVHKLLQFKPALLTRAEDSDQVKKFLKGRERYTVIHDPNFFNPSSISTDKIVEHIRNFYLRTRFS